MKRNVSVFATVVLSILAGLVLKSHRGRGQSPEGPQSPIIIKRVFLVNQTGAPGSVRVFTPSQSGLFRVAFYADITPSSTGQMCPDLEWTDEVGVEIQGIIPTGLCITDGGEGSGSVVIHALQNQPVSLNLGLSRPFDGQFNLFVTAEQL
jgi:hypothetical protein